jgi:hypothetical protein
MDGLTETTYNLKFGLALLQKIPEQMQVNFQ